MLITFDTNRLGWPTPRRFYSTWRERSRDRTRVMPTVARELMPELDMRRLARSVHETAAASRGRPGGVRAVRPVSSRTAGLVGQAVPGPGQPVRNRRAHSGTAPHGARDPQFTQCKLLSAPAPARGSARPRRGDHRRSARDRIRSSDYREHEIDRSLGGQRVGPTPP